MSVRIIRALGVTLGLLTGVAALASGYAIAQTDGASPAVEAAPYNGSYIRRPTIVVSDMESSLALYRDILGFRLGSLKEDPKDSYVYEAFNIPIDAIAMHATLDSDNEKRTLSLVEYKGLERVDVLNAIRRAAVLVNVNGRFGEVKAQLEDGGYHLLSPHRLGESGVEMGFLDPDGHLVVIYQFNIEKK